MGTYDSVNYQNHISFEDVVSLNATKQYVHAYKKQTHDYLSLYAAIIGNEDSMQLICLKSRERYK